MYSDSVIIGYFLNNTDVGVYRVIFQLTSLAAFTTSAFHGVLWPRVSRCDPGNYELECCSGADDYN